MEIILNVYVFTLGAILGSFYNVVIYRLPRKLSISKGTSFCPNCKHRIMPHELIPIVSFLFLRGKCAHCHTPISFRYPLIEFITGLTFLMSYLRFGLSYSTLIAMILASICIIVAMIDIDTMEIYDRFNIMILLLALISLIWISPLPLTDHIIGFFVISVPLYLIAIITNGLGGGDIKLMAVSGLLLGFQATLVAFFVGAILGGGVAVYLLATKQTQMKSLIAFGPYLCVGIFTSYLYGLEMFNWYLSLFWI
jgi:leader peptidase (prepilin peptidase) / N-methyltransferase